MSAHTVVSRLAAAVVAAVAGIISYGHIRHVAIGAGETELSALLLPVGIDGLIIVATLAMLADKRAGLQPRMSARVALGFGIAATVAFNIASAAPTWSARAVAVVPAVSFLLAVEVLARSGRPRTADVTPVDGVSADDTRGDSDAANLTATAPPVGAPALRQEAANEPAKTGDSGTATEPAKADATAPPVGAPKPGQDAATEPANLTATAPPVGAPKRTPRRTPKPRQSNAERVAAAVALTPDATVAELAARLKLSERTVQRYRPAAKAAAVAAASAPSVNGHPVIDGEVTSNAND